MRLRKQPHWELPGSVDSALFLRSLPEAFSAATTIFVEANSMAAAVEELLAAAAQPGPYLPAGQTLWPRSARFRCEFDATLLLQLSQLAEDHAEPELFDHLFLYAGQRPLLEFPDAFLAGSTMYIAASVVEDELRAWAAKFQLRPRWYAE